MQRLGIKLLTLVLCAFLELATLHSACAIEPLPIDLSNTFSNHNDLNADALFASQTLLKLYTASTLDIPALFLMVGLIYRTKLPSSHLQYTH